MWTTYITVRAIHNRSHFMVVQKFWQLFIYVSMWAGSETTSKRKLISPLNKKSHHICYAEREWEMVKNHCGICSPFWLLALKCVVLKMLTWETIIWLFERKTFCQNEWRKMRAQSNGHLFPINKKTSISTLVNDHKVK